MALWAPSPPPRRGSGRGVVDAGLHDGRSIARIETEKLALVAFQVIGSTDHRSRATVRISRGGRDHAEPEAEDDAPLVLLYDLHGAVQERGYYYNDHYERYEREAHAHRLQQAQGCVHDKS